LGVCDPKTIAGVVHFAEYEKLPAKKIWSWGVDADGLDWRKALSDDNSAYLEVQGGLFRNQETYAFLEPRQVIRFSEYWMPVREIGGISRANLAGVASLVRKHDSLLVGFNANQAIPHASVAILNRQQRLFQEKADLVPERAWIHEIPAADSKAKYTIEVRDAEGAMLLRQTEGAYDWVPESEIHVGAQPSYRIPEPDKRTTDDWLQLGDDDELNGRSLDALDTYKEALARFPGSFALAKAAGRLAASLQRYEEAKQFLEPLHLRNTSDTEISYYLGIAYDGLGETQHARAAYEQAERLPVAYSAAALRIGELLAREGDLSGAESHLAGAVKAAPEDIRAYEELVAIKAASGKVDQSRTLAKEGLAKIPLSDFLREEAGAPDLDHLAQDANRVLSVAAEYMRLGLYSKALDVFSRKYPAVPSDQTEPGWPAVQDHSLVAYFRGYCREKLGQSASNDYAAAAKLSASYVFPNTAEELSVLRAVVRSNPSDATAHYLLGTFYFAHGETDAALAEWSQAHKYGPNLPVLSASTGLALLHIKNDSEHALEAFEDGLQSDPQNVAVYVGMDQAQSLLDRPASERVAALQKYPNLDAAPPSLTFELILNLAEAGDFDRAIALFHNHFFAREEGGTNVRQVWIEVQLQRIFALAKARRCEDALTGAQQIGSPAPDLDFTRDGLEPILKLARANYLLGSVYSSCGKPDEAKARFEAAAAAGASPDQTHWAWLAVKQLPQFDQEQWVDRLKVAMDQATSRTESSGYPSWWFCIEGLLERDLGKEQEAEASFHKALLLPDRMLSYHFTRLAKSQATP
jgi:tetratricopeptide (TPR) repeat protein